MSGPADARRAFVVLAGAVLAFRLWLAAAFPMTGDEAYFIYWGAFPDWGYYDHPPMVGWLLAALLHWSSAPWVMRLPSVLLPLALSAGIYLWLRRADPERAALAAAAFLLVPVSVWNVLITTDTPLVLFSFLSALCFARATESGSRRWYAAAGALLGAAFLSKYFAVLLGFAYLAYAVCAPRGARDWRGLGLAYLCAAPFVALNLAWNYEHCWANLMFNLYNRHGDAGWSWRTPLLYALTLLYVVSPPALWLMVRGRGRLASLVATPPARLFACLCVVPFGLFAALSLVKTIGLHWLLAFVPFFFLVAGTALPAAALRRSLAYLGAFSALHVAAIALAAALPLETWQQSRLYDGIVYHFRIDGILRRLEPYAGDFALAADGYSPAVTAGYHAGRLAAGRGMPPARALREHYVPVFGTASSHARHDDLLTDFRRYDGRNLLVLRKSAPQEDEYRPFFRAVETRSFVEAGATFHFVLGRGFDYAAYRDRVLEPVRRRYYAIPAYLPQGRCSFCERYFGERICPPRGQG